jgi:4-amino-4-deoxy-L-arabinose transferase-like glycosyltransferase
MNKTLRAAATSLYLILSVTFLLRAGFLWKYTHEHPRQAVSVIPFLFESGNIAHSLATGNGFSSPFRVDTGPTAWLPPVYPLLLAGVFRVFGVYTFHAYLGAVFLNILFITLACVPIYFAGKRIGGLGVAAGAAWLWAVFPNAILIPIESMWDACLSALLAATIFWATLELAESRRVRDWFGYGLLWGLALLTNTTLAAALPFLLGWLAWRVHKRQEAWLGKVCLSVGVAVLCCVPWTMRNYEVFREFVPVRSILGLQLWLGNNEQTQDVFLGDLHPIYNAEEREKYIQMGEIAYMRAKQSEAVEYMLAHPAREAHLIANRAIAVWSGGTPNPLTEFIHGGTAWFRFVLLFNVLAALGVVVGIIVLFRSRSIYAFPAAVFPAVFPWAYYLTLVLPRYRLAIDPIVMLLMAVALGEMLRSPALSRAEGLRDAR